MSNKMNFLLFAFFILCTFTFAYKISNEESVEVVHPMNEQSEEDFEDLESYKALLARKIKILKNYMKSINDLKKIEEKKGHIWKRTANNDATEKKIENKNM